MTPAQPTALVEVTSRDEDMAARFISRTDGDFPELASLFATHRLAALEEAARVLEEAIAQGYPEPARKVDTCEHGKFGWEGCITCYDEHLTRAVYAIRKAKDLSHEGRQ